MEYKTIIQSIKEFISECPYLDDLSQIHEASSTGQNSYVIEELFNNQGNIGHTYLDGSHERVYQFALVYMFPYHDELKSQIDETGFYEKFQDWIEDKNNDGELPLLREDLRPLSIEVSKTGLLIYRPQIMDKAKYQVQLKLIYEKEK